MSPRRRKHRGERRPGLFDPGTGEAEPERDGGNPLRRQCPWCRAAIGNPCMTVAGRRMRGIHPSRTNRPERTEA